MLELPPAMHHNYINKPKTTTPTSTFQCLHFFHSTAVNKNSLLTKSKLSDKGFSESKE